MSEPERQFDPLTPFEQALSSMTPRVSGFDREQLLFLAGQASAEQGRRGAGRWAWPAAFFTMAAVAASLLLALCIRPEPNLANRREQALPPRPSVAHDERPAHTASASTSADLEPAPAGLAWLSEWGLTPQGDSRLSSPYVRLRDELLQLPASPRRPAFTVETESAAVAEETLPYHKLLERLLEDRPQGRSTRPSSLELN